MRQDMFKIIVERPRKHKWNDDLAARRRDDFEGPTRLGMRAGYGYRALNENLAPLRRYLRAQLGRPWNKVFSEICAGIDTRNTVQQHIRQHIDDFIAINVEIRADGKLIDLGGNRQFRRDPLNLSQQLYVDPQTGLIRLNKDYKTWNRRQAERRSIEEAAIAQQRRKIDDHTLLMLLDGLWFSVRVDALPGEPRYDVLLRRSVSHAKRDDCDECRRLYGSCVYAFSKRQLSKRELKKHGLRTV